MNLKMKINNPQEIYGLSVISTNIVILFLS